MVPGAEERDVGRVVALERAERAGHGALCRVLHEHQGQEELVPGPDGHEDAQRRERRAGKRHVDPPEEAQVLAPSTRAASESSGGMVTKWARIQNTANGMYKPMSGSDDREARVEDPHLPGKEIEGRDDPFEGSVSPNTNRAAGASPGDAERADREPRHRRDDQGIGTTARTMNTLDARSAPMFATLNASTKFPIADPGHRQPDRRTARWIESRREDAEKRQDRDGDQGDQERPAGVDLPSGDPHRSPPRVSRWTGRITIRTRITSTTASAEARPTWRWRKARM